MQALVRKADACCGRTARAIHFVRRIAADEKEFSQILTARVLQAESNGAAGVDKSVVHVERKDPTGLKRAGGGKRTEGLADAAAVAKHAPGLRTRTDLRLGSIRGIRRG